MLNLHNIYEPIAYKLDGSVIHGSKFNQSDLTKFELIPQASDLPRITVDLSGNRKLIFFKRVFCSFGVNSPYKISNIHYHVGYIENGKNFEMSIDPILREVDIL